ncbi:phage capsid protein [Sphingomonas sp. ABOLF]|uniref:GPO family capsid scaffolding protein n=1 Tax=Sphingomonas sp. ABOLF TaxID=1985879 RepID=UPI000F7DA8D1|nr:GPO family capsid scaffolding protein [Sphingomonas sp. ABOLF]RSV12280.1 phage capsid protein [Sphingomonas sp. ABOLF]
MGTKSKSFRAFVEGQTISDGREITPEMIDQIVETFNVETYTPGINIEHISGFSPEPPFNRYGDVIAVSSQIDDITIDGKVEKRKALYMQVDAHDALVELSKKGQKPFPSVELTPSYSGCGKVGLVAVAFTDNPASIATQKLKFSRSSPDTMFSHGTEGVAITFEAKSADAAGISEAIKAGFASVAAMFSRGETQKPPVVEDPKTPANDNFSAAISALGTQVATTLADALKPVTDAQTAMDARFTKLEEQLASTEAPGTFSRKPATGTGTAIVTDC